MVGNRIVVGKGARDEGEKPFWISFSDLMTALMVLFLVVMTISLLAVTQAMRNIQQGEKEKVQAIEAIAKTLVEAAKSHRGVTVNHDRDRIIIEFGEAARFALNDYRISEDGADRLRRFTPSVLDVANSVEGKTWLKRVIVEGFTDPRGTYLHNLHLSLMRAESVVCSLLAEGKVSSLEEQQKQDVRRLFLVGGFSSNSTRASDEESRRVELRLDFRTPTAPERTSDTTTITLGQCRT